MGDEAFEKGMNELYQGEVLGEVIFNCMLGRFHESEHRYKLAVMFQLETETKARLRPALMQLGLDIVELEESRSAGHEVATSLEGMDWTSAMSALRDLVEPYVARYREIADSASPEFRAVAESMANHEKSLFDFLALEASGDGESAFAAIVAQLHNVLPAP